MARPFAEPLTYAVPAWLPELGLGHVVLVPLGQRGGETGYVVGFTESPEVDPAKIKPITRLLDPLPAFDEAQLAFFRWTADYYLAPLGMVIHTALPSQIRAKVLRVLIPTEEGVQALTRRDAQGELAQVLREVVSRPQLTRRGLVRRLQEELEGKAVERAIAALVRKGWVAWSERELTETRGRVRTATLQCPLEELAVRVPRAGRRMVAIARTLQEAGGTLDVAEITSEHGSSASEALRRLEQAGVVAFGEREDRDVLLDAPALGASQPPPLNADQQAALAALTQPEASGAYLLFGVTGSGKTEVFLGAAQAALDRGQQVLVLVPEIGLTPQLVGRFKARFGEDVAVLHSGLTGAQRLAQWRRIRAGEARVAIGARSALFAPFQRLGLLVVDEEHDDSYKQDEGVAYSARDLAVVLGQRAGCPVVLASATPSLESWQNAQTGRYTLLQLPRRATPRPVPRVDVVDLSALPAVPGQERPLLHPDVEHALHATFDRGGQAIVLYNRRGFATMVQCTSCGGTYECPNCGITLTLHRRAWHVACHYCGLKLPYSDACPVCSAETLEELGKGTERVEETLRALFPHVPQARMDADTTAARGAHHRILTDFREGRTKLLVGTQIVAKGHDFPDVHTAVVISADRGFRMPDFRAAERTFALLVQMAGRAGRGSHPGQVFVQTWKADHYVLEHLDDVERFYAVEMRLRATLRYPPFSRLTLLRIDGVERRAVVDAAEALGRDLRGAARGYPGVAVLGPAPAALPRLVGRWRFQIVLRGEQLRPYRAFLAAQRGRIDQASRKGVRVAVDVDPRHLM